MDQIKRLLNQVGILYRKNNDILQATGAKFNMFRICGVNHYENTHSAILAEFFNANGSHGLHDKLLKAFIDYLDYRFTIVDFNTSKSRIYTEYSTEEGRLDIIIIDDKNKAIIIENKLYAEDQPEQLKRYNRYANKYHSQGYQILYLTLDGTKASVQSGEGVNYLSISYTDDIINWLEQSVAVAARYPIVRETIIQYINHLKQLTNQDMDNNNKQEVTTLLSEIENLKLAKTIYENYPATFDLIAEKYFNPKMKEFAEEKGLEYHYEKSNESSIAFYLTNAKWKGEYWIGFRYDGSGYYYGLCNKPENQVLSENQKTSFFECMTQTSKKSISNNGKKSAWWPYYDFIPALNLDNWEGDIVKSDEFLKDCKLRIEQLLEAIKEVGL